MSHSQMRRTTVEVQTMTAADHGGSSMAMGPQGNTAMYLGALVMNRYFQISIGFKNDVRMQLYFHTISTIQ